MQVCFPKVVIKEINNLTLQIKIWQEEFGDQPCKMVLGLDTHMN